jgi:dynein heavy chain 1, cytosolic
MNPNNPDFSNRTASSPALFNRCVIDWFGDWSEDAMTHVATELVRQVDIPNDSFNQMMGGGYIESGEDGAIPVDPKNQALSNMIVEMHCVVRDLNINL